MSLKRTAEIRERIFFRLIRDRLNSDAGVTENAINLTLCYTQNLDASVIENRVEIVRKRYSLTRSYIYQWGRIEKFRY